MKTTPFDLFAWRKARSLTQAQAADVLRVSARSIAAYEELGIVPVRLMRDLEAKPVGKAIDEAMAALRACKAALQDQGK